MSIDDNNLLAFYGELWKTKSEKKNAIRQGIISNDGCTENWMKLRINAGDKNTSNKQDAAITNAYGDKFIIPLDFEMLNSVIPYYQSGLGNDKFIIPLDFEMLDSVIPYYQSGLGNWLCYKIMFKDYY